MTQTDKGPCPYHRTTRDSRPSVDGPSAERQYPGEWKQPKYPGDAVLILLMQHGDEIGDVRVQQYDQHYRVASFTPGYETSFPGDTPKMNPDRDEWTTDRAAAGRLFVDYIIAALRQGWTPLTRR